MHSPRTINFLTFAIVTLLLIFSANGENVPEKKITLVGMGSIENGQVVKGENNFAENGTNVDVSKVWYARYFLHLGATAAINERAKVYVVGEGIVTYSWYRKLKVTNDLTDLKPRLLFYPHHMEGTYCFGDIKKPFLTIGAGVFPFKYNPDVRNLGEYLYRTGTYPPYIINEFDFPMGRLTGLRLSFSFFDSLHLTAMLTAETQMVPYNDYGVSVLTDYTFAKAFTIGAGVFFSHLISVNEAYTTPRSANKFVSIDSTNPANPDTTFYTFRGTKVMGRISFDPKVFFHSDIFGKNDLRLYSEAAILGVKDYPVYYSELMRRIPVMVGFDIPTFKILDVFAVELEWHKYNFPNSYWNVMHFENLPIPGINNESYVYDYGQNMTKWSFFAQRQVGKRFTITGQVAKDHWRLFRHFYLRNDVEESMHKQGDWAWILKCSFGF